MNKRGLFPFSRKNSRGITLLLENIVFIILNLVFIAIIIVFLITKSNSASILEEKYSKEIALMLDSARPGMQITINMAEAVDAAENNLGKGKVNSSIVSINNNVVTVNLGTQKGYSYSFFNNVKFASKPYLDNNKNYVFFIGGYNG
jgi:ABC-type glycerol-3-phosphate transport system permease component